MGTNYYLLTKKVEEGEYPEGGLHIGKQSCGWIFNFQAHPTWGKTVADMRELTKIWLIYNEYGDLVSYDEFWEMVESSKEPYEDGSMHKGITEEGRRMGDYEDEGFPFSTIDFS